MRTLRETRPLYLVFAILLAALALIAVGRPLVVTLVLLLALAAGLTFWRAGRGAPAQP